MDTNIVFTCGADSYSVADILYTEIAIVTIEELLFFEQSENGTYVSAEDIFSPSFRDEFNRVVNKYNLANHSKPMLKPEDAPEKYRWDSPSHWEMMSGDKFRLLDFDDSGDANVRWTFRFRSPERFGNFTATSSRIIKLKYLIARLEGTLNRPIPKSKFKRAWVEFWTNTKYSDIQKDIPPIIEEYNTATTKIQERNKDKETFFSLHTNNSVLHIFLKDGSEKMYLQNQCGFDIFDKEAEIHSKIVEHEKIQEKINYSNNRGEQDVEYHIKWALKTLNKYVICITSDCESKYRYNCILLKNSSFIDEPQEYDHILVTPSGIVLIETKDWKGTIDITPDGKWIRHKEENGTAFGVASPITQMRRHEQLMKSILPDVPVHSLLCFSNPSAIVNGKEHINEYSVINIEQLETELNKICSRNKYSNEKIDEIVTTIDSYKINKMQ